MQLTPLRTDHDHVEDKSPSELRESAYRRGYQQGLYQAIKFLQSGGNLASLQEYAIEVGLWRNRLERYGRARDHVEHPPVPN